MKCPTCKKSLPAPSPGGSAEQSPFFPFCSDRCKLIDLGRWLDGKYQIPIVDREDQHGSAGDGAAGDDQDNAHPPRR